MNMSKFILKLKSYFKPFEVQGEDFVVGVKTIMPKEIMQHKQNSMTPGDRKRYFDNYNQNLINRISDIKSTNS
jgi:uncharacterized protein (UPF0305 family)